jgi:hypothetical protein
VAAQGAECFRDSRAGSRAVCTCAESGGVATLGPTLLAVAARPIVHSPTNPGGKKRLLQFVRVPI